jgi:Flp pilus assembly protein TadB
MKKAMPWRRRYPGTRMKRRNLQNREVGCSETANPRKTQRRERERERERERHAGEEKKGSKQSSNRKQRMKERWWERIKQQCRAEQSKAKQSKAKKGMAEQGEALTLVLLCCCFFLCELPRSVLSSFFSTMPASASASVSGPLPLSLP